jgi:hypothetical protein
MQFLYLHTPTALECAALARDVHLLTLEVTVQRVECPAVRVSGRLGMPKGGPQQKRRWAKPLSVKGIQG